MMQTSPDDHPAPGSSVASRAYRGARDVARRMGLGRLRDRTLASINAMPGWAAVPPHRLKDLDPDGSVVGGHVALTFDDGPNPHVTPRLLELLDSHSVKATFFMCGLAAERHPELVREVAAAGHSIGGHSWDHPHSGVRGLSESEWERQVTKTQALLTELVGDEVNWFRPPRGITDWGTWSALRRQGFTTVMWSVDGWDCKLRDPEEIAAGVLGEIEPGGIILLHDNNATYLYSTEQPAYGKIGNQETTLQAVEIVLNELERRGLGFIAMDELPLREMPRFGRPRMMVRR